MGDELANEPGLQGKAREKLPDQASLPGERTPAPEPAEPGQSLLEERDAPPRELLGRLEDDHLLRRNLAAAQLFADPERPISLR